MRSVPIIDLHEDISYYYVTGASGLNFPLEDFSKDAPGRHADIPKFRRANVRIVLGSIYCLLPTLAPAVSKHLAKGYSTSRYQRAYSTRAAGSTSLEHMKVYYALEELHSSSVRILRSSEDVERIMRKDATGVLIALEGAYAVEDTYDLKLFYNMGLRSLQLAWNFDTRYCASCMSKKDYGLTGEGEEIVRECNKLGIIVDLAHASKKTHTDVATVSKLPFMNSHSNAKAVYDMSRNLDDHDFKLINQCGGVVGSIFAGAMVGKNPNVDLMADHIMHVYDKVGADILALGTDYFGIIDSSAPSGLEDITRIDALFSVLMNRGMSKKEIEKLAFKNSLRVIRENARRWA